MGFEEEMTEYINNRSNEPERVEKRGFFSRLFGCSETKDDYKELKTSSPEAEKPLSPEVQDLKEIARIALDVIKMLPPKELSDFKQSTKFSRLKDILRKYGLIK